MTVLEKEFMEKVCRYLPEISKQLTALNKRLETIENELVELKSKTE